VLLSRAFEVVSFTAVVLPRLKTRTMRPLPRRNSVHVEQSSACRSLLDQTFRCSSSITRLTRVWRSTSLSQVDATDRPSYYRISASSPVCSTSVSRYAQSLRVRMSLTPASPKLIIQSNHQSCHPEPVTPKINLWSCNASKLAAWVVSSNLHRRGHAGSAMMEQQLSCIATSDSLFA
jgi:hypothetical protein